MLRKAHARRSLPQTAAIPAEVAKLEDRTLLLGNVVVGIDGGNVTLTGDSQPTWCGFRSSIIRSS